MYDYRQQNYVNIPTNRSFGKIIDLINKFVSDKFIGQVINDELIIINTIYHEFPFLKGYLYVNYISYTKKIELTLDKNIPFIKYETPYIISEENYNSHRNSRKLQYIENDFCECRKCSAKLLYFNDFIFSSLDNLSCDELLVKSIIE